MTNYVTTLGKLVKLILILPILVLFLVIALPLSLVSALIDLPLKPRRLKNLEKSIKKLWIPRQKYFYLHYETNSVLSDYIEKDLMPKYGRYIVVDGYPRSKLNTSEFRVSANTILRDFVQTSDCIFDAALVQIDKDGSTTPHLSIHPDDSDTVDILKTKKHFDKVLMLGLKEWRISEKRLSGDQVNQ